MDNSSNPELILIFSHQVYNFIVNFLRGIHCPDEIQVIVKGNVLVVNEMRELWKQKVNILRVSQPIFAAIPHCNWHIHVCHTVDGRCGLRYKRERTSVFIGICTLNPNTYSLGSLYNLNWPTYFLLRYN